MDITKINNYKDLFLDVNDFDEDNISYIKPILFYKVIKNMGIYYKKSKDSKKQKIIIQTPKMVLPFGIKEFINGNRKSYQASLSFSTMTNLYNEEEIKKFYYFIKRIDTVNEETIMDYRKEWGLPKKMTYRKTLQRLSKDYPYHMNINLPYDEKMGFLFNIYNEKAEKSNIDVIEKKSIVSVIMELTDLRFTDNEFRANWTILQMRKFKPYSPIQEFFMSGCYIVDNDDPEDKAYAKIVEEYQKKLSTPIIHQIQQHYMPLNTTSIPTHILPTSVSSNKTSQISFKPPTLSQLLEAKSVLKKTTTVEKVKEQGKIVDTPPPPPPPLSKKTISNPAPSLSTKKNSDSDSSKSKKKSPPKKSVQKKSAANA